MCLGAECTTNLSRTSLSGSSNQSVFDLTYSAYGSFLPYGLPRRLMKNFLWSLKEEKLGNSDSFRKMCESAPIRPIKIRPWIKQFAMSNSRNGSTRLYFF